MVLETVSFLVSAILSAISLHYVLDLLKQSFSKLLYRLEPSLHILLDFDEQSVEPVAAHPANDHKAILKKGAFVKSDDSS